MDQNKKITKWLVAVWIVIYLFVSGVVNVYTVYTTYKTGESPLYVLSSLQLVTLFAAALFFYPMLFVIRHYAKRASMKKIHILSLIMIWIFSFWLATNVFVTVMYLVVG